MRYSMRALLATVTLLLMASVVAQDLMVPPKWKRGDTRTLYMTQTTTMPTVDEEGVATEAVATYQTSGKVKVYDITPEKALISIDFENMVLPIVRPYLDGNLPGEIDPYKRMIIRYEVDRTTGEPNLMNATDLLQFVQRASDISLRAVRKKDMNNAAMLEQELAPLVGQFNDPALVAQYFDQLFGFLTLGLGQPLSLNEPLKEEEIQADPFGAPGDSVTVSRTLTVQDHANDQVILKVVDSLDPRSKAVAGKGAAPKARAANDAVIVQNWQQEQLITLDLKTTWPVRMNRKTGITLSNGMQIAEEVAIEVR